MSTTSCIIRPSGFRGEAQTDETHLYVIEYGTSDALKNYQRDGRLSKLSLVGGGRTILAENLPGPYALEVGENDLFIGLDESLDSNPQGGYRVVKVPLDGGVPSLVHDAAQVGFERHWLDDGSSHVCWNARISSQWNIYCSFADEPPQLLVSDVWTRSLQVDETHAFYIADNGGHFDTFRVALDGESEPEILSGAAYGTMMLHSGELFAVRGFPVDYIASLPKTGGVWTNRAEAGRLNNILGLEIRNDRYFALTGGSTAYVVTTGEFSEPLEHESIHVGPMKLRVWAAADEGFYFARDEAIYFLGLD